MRKKAILFALMFIAVCWVLPWKLGGVSAAAAGMPPSGTANLKVIDVSHYQGTVAWSAVKPNVDAVYIKATEGSTVIDPQAKVNATAAQNQGIPFGFYDYFWPYADVSNAAKQADYFYDFIKDYNYSCIPALDLEETNGCSKSQITASVLAFANEFKNRSGLDVMIYLSPSFAYSYLDVSQGASLSKNKLWIANYGVSADNVYDSSRWPWGIWSQWDMWQYTTTFPVAGISVDGDWATDNIFIKAPVITLSSYNTNPTNQNITVTATTDKGTLNASSYTFEQNGSFTFSATDSVTGFVGSRTVTITNIDKTPPVVSFSSGGSAGVMDEGASYASAVGVSFDEGAATLDGASFLSGNTVYNTGSHTLAVTDAAGNQTIRHFTVTSTAGVSYQSHVQKIGWQNTVSNGDTAGTTGQSLRVEAMKISLQNAPAGMHINYRTHVQDVGWQSWVQDGALAGTTGQSLRIEAVQITLSGTDADKYSVEYQAHVQSIGWQSWTYDGQTAGTTGQSLRVEALRIKIVPKIPTVTYQAHVQSVGWQSTVGQGATAGTTGRGLRVEALKVYLQNAPKGLNIAYQAHVQNIGWQNWTGNGAVAGTTGQGLRVEALRLELQGTNAGNYSVLYRAHVQKIGWQSWVADGAIAGTIGQSLRVEAIQIMIVPKN